MMSSSSNFQKTIDEVSEEDFDTLLTVWEASVRATHDFISEDNIQFFKPLLRNEALPSLDLRCIRDANHSPVGFIGVSNGKVEMLFIHPDYFDKGLGKKLLEYAVHHLKAPELDVNEQNPKALGFYKKMGFVVVGRSELDGTGKPFPILHMRILSP
jgi:putative acetyltransferase